MMKDTTTIEIVHDIERIAPLWSALDNKADRMIASGEMACFDYSYYQTLGWNRFLAGTYSSSLVKRLDFVVVRSGGEVVAIIPLLADRLSKKIEMLSGKIAGILNAACPSRLDDMAAREAMAEALGQMAVRYEGWKWKFNDVPRSSHFFEALAARGHEFSERGSFHIPMASFASHDEYVSSLPKNLYKNIRKAYNHLDTDGRTMTLDVRTSGMQAPVALRRKVWTLYFRRKLAWKGQKESAVRRLVAMARGAKEAVSGRRTASMKRLGSSRLITLSIDGELAAFMHIYVHGRYALMPKLAIDASYSRYSPGILLLLETLKMLRAEGVDDFDMCRGDERYKRETGGINQPLGCIILGKSDRH